MPGPANELLYDATIRHQIKLLRYSAGQARAVAKLLKASDDELVAKLQTELTDVSEARLKALLVDIRAQRTAMAERLGEEIQKDTVELAGNEAEWEIEAIRASCPVELKLNSVSPATLKSLASRPINGVPLEGWLGTLKAGDVSRIEQQIRLGVSQGETLSQLVGRIRGTRANNYEDGVTAITRRNAQTIARTSVNHVSNAARQEVWNANADIISGVRWVATLDGRTSDVCRGRDGQVYPIDSGPRPPAHPGCRSTTTPVLDGERILGDRPFVRDARTRQAREVDFRQEAKDTAGDKWKNMSQADRTAAIRAQRDTWSAKNIGQVPSAQTYDSWLRKQPKAFQDEVLGKTKAEIFRKGSTLDKFVDEQGKPYTIAELKTATSQDKLYVTQPGVGMKAKALLQQGLSTEDVLTHIKNEFPDASTSAASIASYKSELKKAGALDQLVGQVPSGGVKQAQAVADVVSNLEMHLPAGVKNAIGGQWANVVEDLDGMPGAYGYYEAGKGVLLSGKKLAAISQQQAQQVAAHELGHLLHKQHDLALKYPMDFAEVLSPGAKKQYGYYLSHNDELTAEIFAQALSPSPLTSQGLSALEFNKAFEASILEAKQVLQDKFPVPHPEAPLPIMGAPSVPFEVAGQHKTVGGLAKALLQQGLHDDGVLAAVKAQFPDAKTSKASLASYKVELKKAGLLPNKASGPTVTVKAVPGVAPVPPLQGVAKTPPVAPGSDPLVAHVKELLKNGQTSTSAIIDGLKAEGVYAPGMTYDQLAELKLKAMAELEAAGVGAKATAKVVTPAPAKPAPTKPVPMPGLKVPKLAGKQLGSVSSGAFNQLKTYFAGAGDLPGAHELLGKVFGGGYKAEMGTDLIELAQYEVATGKAVAKPYLAAAYNTTDWAAAEAAKVAKAMSSKSDLLKVIGVPARPALTPREGIPPPPRFDSQQRRAAIQYYDRLNTAVTTKVNAAQKAKGLQELSVEEASAIHAYTGSTYTTLNNALRKGEYTTNLALQAYTEAAQHGMAKMPKFVGLTSRGMSIPAGGMEKLLSVYRVGQVVEEAAFISTSAGDRAAFGGNVIVRIMGKTGVDVSSFSKFPGEREVLYMPGTRLKVLKVEKTGDKTIITMEEL